MSWLSNIAERTNVQTNLVAVSISQAISWSPTSLIQFSPKFVGKSSHDTLRICIAGGKEKTASDGNFDKMVFLLPHAGYLNCPLLVDWLGISRGSIFHRPQTSEIENCGAFQWFCSEGKHQICKVGMATTRSSVVWTISGICLKWHLRSPLGNKVCSLCSCCCRLKTSDILLLKNVHLNWRGCAASNSPYNSCYNVTPLSAVTADIGTCDN